MHTKNSDSRTQTIRVVIDVTEEHAARFFKSHGIEVVEQEVVNPTNGKRIPLREAYLAAIENKKKLFIESTAKLDLYTALNSIS